MSRLDEALARLERAVARLEAACTGAPADEKGAPRRAEHSRANPQLDAVFGEGGAARDSPRARIGQVPEERGDE